MERRGAVVCSFVLLLAALANAGTFREQRAGFRQEINLKAEEPMDKEGLFHSVTFKNEKEWNFQVSPEEREELKAKIKNFFDLKKTELLDPMVNEMSKGRFIVYKEYSPESEGVNLKCAFLSPKVPYWKYLTDIAGIEKLFYVYNFSVELGKKSPDDTYVLLQTQGRYMGFRKAVTLPLLFHADQPSRTLSFSEAGQKEITDVVESLPVRNPGRTSLNDRFLDLCRSYAWFQDKDAAGKYLVSDIQILELLDQAIIDKDKKCDVYASDGGWKIDENLSDNYLFVTYTLKTAVNLRAFIPPNIPLLGPMFKRIAQSISGEVSAKYLPLSMKNFRDLTGQWAKEAE